MQTATRTWSYTGTHPATVLFTEARAAGAPLRFEPGMHILEIGCAEHDWLTPASEAWPDVTFRGVDPRITGDAMDARLFAPASFDGIVALSTIEHIGLGHYGDPVDADGDILALANAWRWLKPGGWLYFDVPYNPDGYRVVGTSHRVYDRDEVWTRLWQEPLTRAKARGFWSWTLYADQHGHLVEEPLSGVESPDGFGHYIALGWQKVG